MASRLVPYGSNGAIQQKQNITDTVGNFQDRLLVK